MLDAWGNNKFGCTINKSFVFESRGHPFSTLTYIQYFVFELQNSGFVIEYYDASFPSFGLKYFVFEYQGDSLSSVE